MDSLAVIEISRQTIYLLLKISLPILTVALIVGLVISLFQALTQIQEPTLSFVPKIIAIFCIILLTLTFIGSNMMHFTEEIMTMIVHLD